MKDRIFFIDVARSLCVFWIVAIWHMNQYMREDCMYFPAQSMSKDFANVFTNGVLALFTLISGFFMSMKTIDKQGGVWEFYRKRLFRFEIPLLVSCICLSLIGYISKEHIVTISLGISQFMSSPYPKTLWFFSMIIFFYLITPLLLMAKSRRRSGFLFLVVGIYFFLYVTYSLGYVDVRMLNYYPFYVLPFLVSEKDFKILSKGRVVYWCVILFPIIVWALFSWRSDFFVWSFFMNLLICLWILSLSYVVPNNMVTKKTFSILAYSSMFAYLFHREFYILVVKTLGKFNMKESLFLVVLLLGISYGLQLGYDYCFRKLIHK